MAFIPTSDEALASAVSVNSSTVKVKPRAESMRTPLASRQVCFLVSSGVKVKSSASVLCWSAVVLRRVWIRERNHAEASEPTTEPFGLVEGIGPSVTRSCSPPGKGASHSFRQKRSDDTVGHHPSLLGLIPCRMHWCRTWPFLSPNTLLVFPPTTTRSPTQMNPLQPRIKSTIILLKMMKMLLLSFNQVWRYHQQLTPLELHE